MREKGFVFRKLLTEFGQLVLPKYCFGCGAPKVLFCTACKSLIYVPPREKSALAAPIEGCPPLWVWGEYQDLIKKFILMLKQFRIPQWQILSWESGYNYWRSMQGVTARALLKGTNRILVVPAPSATRTVGERPVYWFARGIVDAINTSEKVSAEVADRAEAILWDGLYLFKNAGKQAGKSGLERSRSRYLQMGIGEGISSSEEVGTNQAPMLKLLSESEIYLCDDVVTTGATLNEMVRVIKAEGGQITGIFCLAYVKNISKKDVR